MDINELTDKQIKEKLIDELHETLRSTNSEDSIDKVVEFDRENQTITIKFNYHVVEDDNYIGFSFY